MNALNCEESMGEMLVVTREEVRGRYTLHQVRKHWDETMERCFKCHKLSLGLPIYSCYEFHPIFEGLYNIIE